MRTTERLIKLHSNTMKYEQEKSFAHYPDITELSASLSFLSYYHQTSINNRLQFPVRYRKLALAGAPTSSSSNMNPKALISKETKTNHNIHLSTRRRRRRSKHLTSYGTCGVVASRAFIRSTPPFSLLMLRTQVLHRSLRRITAQIQLGKSSLPFLRHDRLPDSIQLLLLI
jgi:hypothetical protein